MTDRVRSTPRLEEAPKGPYAVGRDRLAAGDAAAALPHLEKAVHFHPQSGEAHACLAAALHRLDRWSEARRAAAEAVERDPTIGAAWLILGEALHHLDDPFQALNALETALRLKPRDVRVWATLAEVYAAAGDRERALALSAARVRAQPADPSAHRHAAMIALECGRHDEALTAADAAERAGAEALSLTDLRSDALLALGRTEEAIAVLAAAAPARGGGGLYGLARAMNRDDHERRAHLFAPIAARLAEGGADLGPAALYALAEHRHKLGEVDGAFAAFARGAETRWREADYDEARMAHQLAAAVLDARTLGAHAPIDPKPSGPTPIFILGMSRSGTTLTEQILAAHPQVAAGGELGTFGALAHRHGVLGARGPDRRARLKAVRDGYQERIGRIAGPIGAAMVTDKMPFNFSWIGPIAESFPEAPILLLRRDLRDVGWSNYRTLFRSPLSWTYDFDALARYLGRFDAVCAAWLDRLGDRIRIVDHAALVAAPEIETRRLVADCGLAWRAECLAPEKASRLVRTASKFQVREPINAKGLGAWRRYETHLRPFVAALRAQDLRFAPID